MTIIELNEDNAWDYGDWIPSDVAENLEREYHHGFLAVGDLDEEGLMAGMVYELLHYDEEKPTEAFIKWLQITDESAAEPLFEAYKKAVSYDYVEKSSYVIPVKGSEKEKAALKGAGFSLRLTEGDNVIVSMEELEKLPIMKSRKVPDSIGALNQVTTRAFRRVISKCVLMGRKGVCEDLEYLPLGWFEPEVSCISEKDGEINGLFLVHKMPSGMLAIQLMVAMTKDPQPVLLGMMRRFIISLEENYGEDVKVMFDRHNQSSFKLSEKLLPRGFGIPVYAGSREE